MRRGAKRYSLVEPARGLDIGQHQRGSAIGHQRTVGALERTGNKGILLADVAAELETQILAHLRVGIANTVLVVLGGDHRQRVGLVTPALEIATRDLAE